MRTNVAQRALAYYSSRDFENNYAQELFEDFLTNEFDVKNRIAQILSNEDIKFTGKMVNEIYDHIYENIESFVCNMCNYYVGYNCLESVAFGEQEEQLSGYDMNMAYLKRVFNREGFYVNKNGYAYYDMTGEGLFVELKMTEEIKTILNTKENEAN